MKAARYIRDLQPGDRFYLLRNMIRYQYIGTSNGDHLPMRHGVRRLDGGEMFHRDLHHSCHVKKIERAA